MKTERPTLLLFGLEVHVCGEPAKDYFTRVLLDPDGVNEEEHQAWRPMREACGSAMMEVQQKGIVPGLLELHGSGINSIPTAEKGYVTCWPKKYAGYDTLQGEALRDHALAQLAGRSRFHHWPPRKPFEKMPDRYWAD